MNTKIFILLVFSLANCIFLFAQTENNKKNAFRMYVAPSTEIRSFHKDDGSGGNTLGTDYIFVYGFEYSGLLSERWSICSGFEHYDNSTYFTDRTTTIPIQFKRHYGKIFYVNYGAFININAMKGMFGTSRYFHLGFGFGFGFRHEFCSGIELSLNPYARLNGIGKESFGGYIQSGVSAGVGYKF